MFLRDKRILYFFDASDWDSRIVVARAAKEQGADVTICLIDAKEDVQNKSLDFRIIPLCKRQGASKSIVASLKMLCDIRKIITEEKPDIIHAVTLKYSLITAIASLAKSEARKVFTIAGLGYLYHSDGIKSVVLRYMLWPLLILAFRRKQTHLIFQNVDDLALFIDKKIAAVETSHLIKGSGVYLDRFDVEDDAQQEQRKNAKDKIPLVLMPTRLVHEKGVAVFVEAARIIKSKNINARFEIAGGLTHDNPRAITQQEMEEMVKDGAVTWLGRINTVPQKLKEAAFIVYPSYYGEGIPRVLLEACAAGCPIITTDHPGCREAVEHEGNGLLVPVKDPQSTAAAIETLLADQALCKAMGDRSRQKACEEFDIYEIARQTLDVYRDITSRS
ncbi:MAG: glycosyltransferase family 4 protein [Alphaproteobacteria bacterium]|nr:glycosyltransferase family 4 protein [Alphaproteobacteria bacterium]